MPSGNTTCVRIVKYVGSIGRLCIPFFKKEDKILFFLEKKKYFIFFFKFGVLHNNNIPDLFFTGLELIVLFFFKALLRSAVFFCHTIRFFNLFDLNVLAFFSLEYQKRAKIEVYFLF